ncbi:type III secretion system chaperone [Pseudomonas asuensis]|nr:type III secretion system chaperone [Pseudomonas asuensis]
MNVKAVNEMLHSLGCRDRIGNLTLADNGCAGLSLSDGTSVYFEWSEPQQTLHVYTPLSDRRSVASNGPTSQELYRALLSLNCLAEGPLISMHPQHEHIYLQMRFPVSGLDVEALDTGINDLMARRNSLHYHLTRQGFAL